MGDKQHQQWKEKKKVDRLKATEERRAEREAEKKVPKKRTSKKK